MKLEKDKKYLIDLTMYEGVGEREEASRAIQDKLFALGYRWFSSGGNYNHVTAPYLATGYFTDYYLDCDSNDAGYFLHEILKADEILKDEWRPKTGERVLAWDEDESFAEEVIYLCQDPSPHPVTYHLCKYEDGDIEEFMHVKQLSENSRLEYRLTLKIKGLERQLAELKKELEAIQ